MRTIATVEINLLTLQFYRDFDLPTCDNCTSVPPYSPCLDNLSLRRLYSSSYVGQILFCVKCVLVAGRVWKREPFPPFKIPPCSPSSLPSAVSQLLTRGTSLTATHVQPRAVCGGTTTPRSPSAHLLPSPVYPEIPPTHL